MIRISTPTERAPRRRQVQTAVSSLLLRRDLDDVVEKRCSDILEQVWDAVWNDDHVAFDERTCLAAFDRVAALLVLGGRLAIDHLPSGHERRGTVEHVDDIGVAGVDLGLAVTIATAGVNLVLASFDE